MLLERTHERVYRVGHMACGIGAGAAGFNDAEPRVANIKARFECAGGIDVDAGAIRNFKKLTGVAGSVMDLFSRDQYLAFHGHEPPEDWREATPADIRNAFGGYDKPLDVMFASFPCKGFSGLLDKRMAGTEKYSALNALTLRGIWLLLEAYRDDPVRVVLFENVPRIATMGRGFLDEIIGLLRGYGYSVSEDSHDCGKLGGLAQHRNRYLLIARHMERVPPFIYKPVEKPMKNVGDLLSHLPLPGDPRGGPMHRIPSLQFKTWLRLALVEPGSDWRSLKSLRVENGRLADWGIAPIGGAAHQLVDPVPANPPHNQVLGVRGWSQKTGTVTGASRCQNGTFAVADPRYKARDRAATLGVKRWSDKSGTIAGQTHPTNGAYCVADPQRQAEAIPAFQIVPIDAGHPLSNPHPPGERGGRGKYRVTRMGEPAGTVIAASTTGEGAFAVADPAAYAATEASPIPKDGDRGVWRIIARDGTWHRPYTVLDLAALQSLFDPTAIDWDREHFDLDGTSEASKREWLGNAVPRAAAAAVATTIGEALIMADMGVEFQLSSQEIWVKPAALALSVDTTGAGGALHLEAMLGG